MGVLVDKAVLSTKHHYTELTRDHMPPDRNATLPADTFKQFFQLRRLDSDTRSLRLQSVVGYGDSDFYGPSASTMAQPYIDLIVRREARSSGNLALAEFAWLTQLVPRRSLVWKNADPSVKYLVMGHGLGDIVWTWRAMESLDVPGCYIPIIEADSRYVPLCVLNSADWSAQQLGIKCPMYSALRKTKPDATPNDLFTLPPSSTFGRLRAVAVPIDIPRPLLEQWARCGCNTAPLSYIYSIADFYEYDMPRKLNLPQAIAFVAKK